MNREIFPLMLAGVLLTGNTAGHAEEETLPDYRHYLQAGYQVAYVLPMNDFIKGENAAGEPITSMHAARIELGWQTTGAKRWHQIWNYPSFGIGLTKVDYFNDREVGMPGAVYGFVSLPVKRWERWTLSIAPGFGLSFGWKPFDPVTNPYNQSIGAYKAAFIDINTHFTYYVNPHWDFILGLPAYHFSNGGTKNPNNGFNQIGPMATVRYKFEAAPREFRHWDDIPAFRKNDELIVLGSWGLRNVAFDPAQYDPELERTYGRVWFSVTTLSAAWMRQTSHMSKWGVGVDIVSDESTKAQIDAGEGHVAERDISGFDQARIGIFGAYEFVIQRLSILGNLGYTVRQKGFDGQLPRLYQRLGFKYHFTDHWFAGLNVRFKEFSSADHLEWVIGYRHRFGRKH